MSYSSGASGSGGMSYSGGGSGGSYFFGSSDRCYVGQGSLRDYFVLPAQPGILRDKNSSGEVDYSVRKIDSEKYALPFILPYEDFWNKYRQEKRRELEKIKYG